MMFLEFHGLLGSVEGLAANWWLSLKDSGGNPPLVMIEIDDTAYRSVFKSESPLAPAEILDLVWNLAASKPTVIGVDLMTDSPAYARLVADIVRERGQLQAPVVWAAGATATLPAERETFAQWLGGHSADHPFTPSEVLGKLRSPDETWAIPIYPPEQDRGVRRLPRQVLLAGFSKPQPTWARVIAERYCGTPCGSETASEILIPYGKPMPESYRLCDIIACPDLPAPSMAQQETFRKEVSGKIVLLGGTFAAARDVHFTPLGPLSGLALNAYAVRAEIAGGLHDVHHAQALALDIFLSAFVLVAFAFHKWKVLHSPLVVLPQYKPVLIQSLYKVNLLALAGAFVVFLLLYITGTLWLSWPGVLAGMTLALLVDIWLENPEVPSHPGTHSD